MAVQQRTLEFVCSLQVPNVGHFAYSYKRDGPAILYASCYAALTFHLCGKLQTISSAQRREWATYIQSFQSPDGLFRDPRISCEMAETCDWWGWRHLTVHALMALSALESRTLHGFEMLDRFRVPGFIQSWLESRNWVEDTCGVSNEVQNVGTLMQYARDFLGQPEWDTVLVEMYDWLDQRQDVDTGLWGARFDTPRELSLGIQSAYHFWMLYFYDRRPVKHSSTALDSCLRSQTSLGGFGYLCNTSACEDIDSIDSLVRLAASGNHSNTSAALLKTLPWVLAHQNHDGGWVFRRHEKLAYGHTLMTSAPDESALFPTWFRLLSIALLSKGLPGHPISQVGWKFLETPGHQFWDGRPSLQA